MAKGKSVGKRAMLQKNKIGNKRKSAHNNKPLKISPKNKTSALQVKKTHKRGAVDKSTYASKSCASCGYKARHLHKFCPMCVLCKDCENKVMNCECRESE